jgi:hypothetical protein
VNPVVTRPAVGAVMTTVTAAEITVLTCPSAQVMTVVPTQLPWLGVTETS